MGLNKENVKWYDSGHTITNLIIATIFIILLGSQSFIQGETWSLAGSIINHNSIYFLVLIYFLSLKFSSGRKYFNYFNIYLIIIYGISCVTSFINLVQGYSLISVLSFTIEFVLLIYLIHTLLRDTSFWKDFKLNESPFNELTNEWLFYCILVVGMFLLAVKLISIEELKGVIVSILDFVYYVLIGRYLFLYREYLDNKKIDSDNTGNFDSIRENIKDTVKTAKDKVDDVLEKTDIDEKIIDLKDKVVSGVNDVLDKTDIDEKLVEAKDKAVTSIDGVLNKNKVVEKTEKNATNKSSKRTSKNTKKED